ncbi:MAG: glycerol kinase, partial [Microbacterium sp.]
AVGLWTSRDELRAHWKEDRRFEPQMEADERERRYRLWKKAVEKSMDWVDDDARTLMDTLD